MFVEPCGQLWEILKGFQSVIITILCYPVFILIGIIFVPYRCIIDIILRVKTGKKYGGLLAPTDAFFFREEKSKIYVTGVLILKSKKKRDIFKEFRQILQKKVFDTPFYPKLTGTVGKFGGYIYLNKNASKLDDCLKKLNVPENVAFDEDYLKVLAAAQANKPLSQNDTVLWEFLCSKKPLNDLCDGYYYYPIIARVHHAVADGTSIAAFVLNLLGEDETGTYNDKIFSNRYNKSCEKMSFLQYLSFLLEQVKETTRYIILTYFMGFGRLLQNDLYIKDKNALHGPVLTGEKIVAWATEDSVELIPLVKKIKNRLDTTFTSVIMTAVLASLTNFFKRNSHPVPKSISVLLAQLLAFPKLEKSKPVPLQNNATGICVNIPINPSSSLIESVARVSKSYDDIKFMDIKIITFFFNYAAILPIYLVNKLITFKNQTLAMTNVPGGAKIKLRNGCVLEKIIPLAGNLGQAGITIGMFSYDNRFQLGLLIDKALIQSQKEVQRIADDVFYYIAMMDKETRALEKRKLK